MDREKIRIHAKKFLKKHPGIYHKLADIYLSFERRPTKKDKLKYASDKKIYISMQKKAFPFLRKYENPFMSDYRKQSGSISSYFWQDLWAARLIHHNNPNNHYDIGSRVDGFIAHLASFRNNINIIDVRPLDIQIPGITFVQGDATYLTGIRDQSVESISALCSLEHFGLGRYGDPIDPDAYYKAMKSIVRVMAPGGHAYISVPIGWEHLEFNSCRVFYVSTIIDIFKPMKLVELAVANGREFEESVTDYHKYDNEKMNSGDRFGLFHFVM